jgi:hypothetical protein
MLNQTMLELEASHLNVSSVSSDWCQFYETSFFVTERAVFNGWGVWGLGGWGVGVRGSGGWGVEGRVLNKLKSLSQTHI